jgi:hypothetical protein
MAMMSPSECEVCGMSLQGRQKVEIGDHAFCSKACADVAQARRQSPPEEPPNRPTE